MGRQEHFEIIVTLMAQTERAIQVDDGTNTVWLPKSQIEFERNPDGTYTVTAPEWLLKDKELI